MNNNVVIYCKTYEFEHCSYLIKKYDNRTWKIDYHDKYTNSVNNRYKTLVSRFRNDNGYITIYYDDYWGNQLEFNKIKEGIYYREYFKNYLREDKLKRILKINNFSFPEI